LILIQIIFKWLGKTKNNPYTHYAKMVEGKGCNTCILEHDGNFYRFCKCSCHDKVTREIVDEGDIKRYAQ